MHLCGDLRGCAAMTRLPVSDDFHTLLCCRRPWKVTMALVMRVTFIFAVLAMIALLVGDAKLGPKYNLLAQTQTSKPLGAFNQQSRIPFSTSTTRSDSIDSQQDPSNLKEISHQLSSSHSQASLNNSDNPCDGYQGVLMIDRGDDGAAATTLLFLYVINYLIYADMYNLLPWVHFSNVSHRVYDHAVHGENIPSQHVQMLSGMVTTEGITGTYSCTRKQLQGPVMGKHSHLYNLTVNGTGVWNSYFEPLSPFSPAKQCHSPKPLLIFSTKDLAALHYRWPYSVRSWHYIDCAQPSPDTDGYFPWYGAMRRRGHEKVVKYFKPLPWLMERVDLANPTNNCLAMHARFTDKSGNRAIVSLDKYLPYVEAFFKLQPAESDAIVYLATDSSETVETIARSWPAHVASRVRTQSSVLRSANETAVFDLGASSHHRTNTEVLVDVYAMAKCAAFLHGRSAVSEAVFYVNIHLHNRSVDLEDPQKPSVQQFKQKLKQQRRVSNKTQPIKIIWSKIKQTPLVILAGESDIHDASTTSAMMD